MKLLADFHQAILTDDGAKIAHAIKPHSRLSPEEQFAIYSNGYRIRLLAAIRSDYPALTYYLGDKKFDNAALQYIEKNPPTSYNLDFYPHKFAEFYNACHPREGGDLNDIFATELAILEATIAEVFMLSDSQPLAADALSKLTPEEFGDKKLQLRTASRMLKFFTNANDYLTSQRENKSLNPNAQSQFILIYRHNNEVHRYELSNAEFLLLQQLLLDNTILQSLEKVTNEHEELAETITTSIQRWFQEWLNSSIFQNNHP